MQPQSEAQEEMINPLLTLELLIAAAKLQPFTYGLFPRLLPDCTFEHPKEHNNYQIYGNGCVLFEVITKKTWPIRINSDLLQRLQALTDFCR